MALERGVDGGRTDRERTIADLAARQRGLVTRTQLVEAGLTHLAIDHRLRSVWRLHPAPAEEVEVTVAGRRRDSQRGIRVHRAAALDRRDVRRLGGIPDYLAGANDS